MSLRVCILLPLIALCGCGQEVPKPPAEPLTTSVAELSRLYKWGPGPWPMMVAPELNIAHAKRDGELRIRVHYPGPLPDTSRTLVPTGAMPVLVFSHGNWSDNDNYDRLIEHWVSHGYVVAAPRHRDANGGYVKAAIDMIRFGNLGLIEARAHDLIAVLDVLEEIAQRLPETTPPLDLTRIAATGHSFGAFNAQQLGGAVAFDTDKRTWLRTRDERVKAVVAISPPGPMFDEITKDSWRELDTPTLITTGTWDANAAFWPDWRLHKMSFETAVAGEQYALVLQGADHYFGNLMGRPNRDEAPQTDALNLANVAIVAFLDAYLKQDPAAKAFLRSPQLAAVTRNFAVLEYR